MMPDRKIIAAVKKGCSRLERGVVSWIHVGYIAGRKVFENLAEDYLVKRIVEKNEQRLARETELGSVSNPDISKRRSLSSIVSQSPSELDPNDSLEAKFPRKLKSPTLPASQIDKRESSPVLLQAFEAHSKRLLVNRLISITVAFVAPGDPQSLKRNNLSRQFILEALRQLAEFHGYKLCLAAFACLWPMCASAGTCPSSAVYGYPNYNSTLSSIGVTSCFFIDMTSGSDSNTGADETHAWQHSPEMANASGNASSHTVAAGDGYIFKGGASCPNACFTITFSVSGTSGNPIYYGYDPNWGAGRPIFNAGGTSLSGSNDIMLNILTGVAYRILDNIELSGFWWPGNGGGSSLPTTCGSSQCAIIQHNGTSNHNPMSRLYFHAWAHSAFTSCTNGSCDAAIAVLGANGAGFNAGSFCDLCVFDGSDTDECSMEAVKYFPRLTNSFVGYVSNGIVTGGGAVLVSGNTFTSVVNSCDATDHSNVFEDNGQASAVNEYIYNNYLYANTPPFIIDLTPGCGGTDYVWNNVLDRPDNNAYPITISGNAGCSPSTGSAILWNNTVAVEGVTGGRLVHLAQGPIGSVTIQNNFFISNDGTDDWLGIDSGDTPSTLTRNHNLNATSMVSISAANSGGYSATSWATTSGTGATVGAGTNLASNCSGSLASLCSDTSLGVTYNTSTHTVTAGSRNTNSRPTIWDAGGYQYSPAMPSIPSPLIKLAGLLF